MAMDYQHDSPTQDDQSSKTMPQQAAVEPNLLKGLEWRSIGPYRGGRVVAVAADPVEKQRFYFGSTGGGVWKTTDGGLIWENSAADWALRRCCFHLSAVRALWRISRKTISGQRT